MIKTYYVQAQCVRSFTAWIEIEADAPEEALTKVRLEGSALIAAAEDSEFWPWDQFTVVDHSGNALLQVRDKEARLRDAAPALLEALQEALDEIEYFHADMLTDDERSHPRGSGWARVYDKGKAAIAQVQA